MLVHALLITFKKATVDVNGPCVRLYALLKNKRLHQAEFQRNT